MTNTNRSDYFELSDYLGVLRRRWIIIVAAAVIGAVLAGAYYVAGPKSYTASVLIQVNPLPTNANSLGGRSSGAVNMDNEAQIVQSAQVGSLMRKQLHSSLSPAQISQELSVSVPANTTFLNISCTSSTAAAAQACANSAGTSYLTYRRLSALRLITADINALTARASSLSASLQKLKLKFSSGAYPAASAAKQAAQLRIKTESALLSSIDAHINSSVPLQANLAAPGNTLVGVVSTPADLPTSAASPQARILLPSGLAVGLVIGLVLAFYLDRRNPYIYGVSDLERVAEHPTIRQLVPTDRRALTGLASPRSQAGQIFTELAQYSATTLGDGNHVIAVVSTAAGSAGSVASANLALALARTRGDTVLVCQGATGRMTAQLVGGRDEGSGFSELLTRTAMASDVAQATKLPGLRVITPGYGITGAAADLRHDTMAEVILDLRRRYQYVVIDMQMAGDEAGNFGLTEFSDAAIVVAQVKRSRSAHVADCVERLELLRTPLLALLLLPPSVRVDQRGFQAAAKPRGRRKPQPSTPDTARAGDSATSVFPAVLSKASPIGTSPSLEPPERTDTPSQAAGN